MDRRQFIRFSALTGSSATLASCGNPETQLIRFIPEERLDPGVAVWKPGLCTLCRAGCGMSVRVMEGDVEVVRDGQAGLVKKALAKKLEGLAEHPVSRGALCVRGQAGLQVTYHPDRLAGPLRRTGDRGSGAYEPVSWDDALAEVREVLDGLIASDRRAALACLTRPLRGQRNRLVGEFLSAFGAGPPITFEVFDDTVLREANFRSFGRRQLPTVDLDRSRYVVVFGADLLGTWNSPVAQNRGYGTMRQGRPGIRGKLVQVESRMSQTGAKADEWVPARPGTEGVLALGLAHVIMAAGQRSPEDAGAAGPLIAGWPEGLADFAPDRVAAITGVPAARIERLGREFGDNLPAVAVVGGAPLAHTNGMFAALAVNALNALVGSVGVEGGITFTPQTYQTAAGRGPRVGEFAESLLARDPVGVDALFINDVNPVFGSPRSWRIEEALSRIGFIVSFGSFIDETSALADLILPDHSGLESWLDDVPESGTTDDVWSIAPPVMRPLHDTRAMPDVLLEVARSISPPLDPLLGWASFEDMLEQAADGLPLAWIRLRERGGWWEPSPLFGGAAAVEAVPTGYEDPSFDGDPEEFPFHLLPYASQSFYDGSLAHLPWLQELPDVLTSAMWSNWVEMNPRTAEELGIESGDLVEVTSAHGSVRAPALVYPGIAPDLLAMPVGQGHTSFTRYASGRGSNPLEILAPATEAATGALAWAATRVRVVPVGGESNLILFGGALREHEETSR
jgi:anaerobic selenocysteine-containing dehydrogenase